MLLKTKLVATGVAATLTAGLGVGVAFNGAEKFETFEKNHNTVHESATEMDNAKSTIDSLVEKMKGAKGALEDKNNDLINAKQELEDKNNALISANQELEDKNNALTSATQAFKKANAQVAVANTFVEGLSRMAKEQTNVLTNSKSKLKEAMANAQDYLNDGSEVSTVK